MLFRHLAIQPSSLVFRLRDEWVCPAIEKPWAPLFVIVTNVTVLKGLFAGIQDAYPGNITVGKDHGTCCLVTAFPNEERAHESWFSEYLGEGSSCHFMTNGETSPFVRKFPARLRRRLSWWCPFIFRFLP
ncbi:hypothetical protein Cpha266_1245 [Chlorobium phaeobacteroides DSM 266]|uniref:Uncharacterized protein n=1 Tax=Chlorobium phaeobacteroides (strain DSM 266 / SMG 266 / 2430) TaxID=290317 RepID=A1BFV1_CHLPD|nr:hypothetical protein [Chlorobium phaeobacteroides]ABL65278.1 hypothetical protein Cpha266_1245 [Chlorobium phaeobacteroides DSM 266]